MQRLLALSIRIALFLFLCAALRGHAQTPTTIPLTGNVGAITGGSTPYASVSIQLANCPAPIRIPGYSVIVQQSYDIQADSSGAVNSNLWPNDLIDCNGTTGNSQYSLQYIVNGTPAADPSCYQVTQATGIFNLNTQLPIACGVSPPNPQDGSFNNLTVNNCLSIAGLPCGTFSGPIVSPKINGVINAGAYTTIEGALAACPVSGACVIQFPTGSWTTSLYSYPSCISRSNLTLIGAGRPWFDSMTTPTQLVGGTIIKPGLLFCGASNVTVLNMGFDDGPAYFTLTGKSSGGLVFEGASGGSNPADPLVTNIVVQNTTALGASPSAAQHAHLFEHINGANISNIASAYDTHCNVIKSQNVNANNLFGMGCGNDSGVLIKGDDYTAAGNINVNGVLANTVSHGDSANGVIVDAEASATPVSQVNISNVVTNGTTNVVNMFNNSGVGLGGLNTITINGVVGNLVNLLVNGSCLSSQTSSGGHQNQGIQISNFLCVNSTAFAVAPVQIYNDWFSSQISNWTSVNAGYSSTLGGTIGINGWFDGGASSSVPTFITQDSTTVIDIGGYRTSRGNLPYTSLTAGSIINMLPYSNPFASDMFALTPFVGGGNSPVYVRGGSGSANDFTVLNAAGNATAFNVTDAGQAQAGNGIFSSLQTVSVTALSTATPLTGSASASGLLRMRDNSNGGTALFLIDPNGGVQLIGSSQITGISSSAAVTYTLGVWNVSLASGSVPRTISWTIVD
jgi:hypothetical protein